MNQNDPIVRDYYRTLKREGVPVAHRTSHCLGFIDGWEAAKSTKPSETLGDWVTTIYPQMLDAEAIPAFRHQFRLAGFRAGWEWYLANR